jgi:KaiC/GvpD/RAD55 family RecA-like ATPase
MLILALVPALSVTPSNVSGQGYVTITTQTAGLYTSAATTRNVTETTSTNIYPRTGAYGFTFYACPSGQNSKLRHWAGDRSDPWNAVQGERYHFEWTANSSLDLYIVSNPQVLANAKTFGCDDFPTGLALYHHAGATGSVDWVAPGTGQFIAWLWNFNPSQTVSGIWSIQRFVTMTVQSISYVTVFTTELLTLTTAASAPVSQVGLPFGNLGLLGAVVAVAVIAGVLVIARRRKTSVAATLVQERPATVLEPSREAVAPQPVTPTKTTQPQPVISEIPPIISTGYADLDKALNGGIPEEFAVVIVSPSFDERDLLLRKVVNSALASGRLAILISNDMGRTKDMASRYPSGFYALSPQADRISQHGPNLLKIPSFENLSDANISLGLVLKDVLAKEKATKRIMIVDILSDLLLRHKSVVTRRWLGDFVGKRKTEGFTVIATLNPLSTTKEETQSIIDYFDGVIEIFEKPLQERSRRFLVIKKMYGQRYSESEVLMDKDKLF